MARRRSHRARHRDAEGTAGANSRNDLERRVSGLARSLGARPLRGRTFVADDERDGPDAFSRLNVAILSYGLWQEWFGGREDAIGGVISLDDQPVTIVGVMPPEFAFPDRETRTWLPMAVGSVKGPNGVRRIQIFGALARLKPGVTPQRAVMAPSRWP